MEEADKLCTLLYSWLEKRKHAAQRLLALAEKLEELHSNVNAAKLVGNTASVAGLIGAGIATICTAGLATPFLIGAGVGAAVTFGSSLAEAGISKDDIAEAQKVVREDEEMGKAIEKQLEELHNKCAEQTPTTHASSSSADAVELEVMTQLMGQIGRRNNIAVPLEVVRCFYQATLHHKLRPGRIDPMRALNSVNLSIVLTGTATLALGAVMTEGFKFAAKEAGKDIGIVGIRTAITGGLKVVGIGFGLALSLYDLIENIEEMVSNNHATKASEALRHAAGEIMEHSRNLQKKLDALKEIIKKLSQLKDIVKNLGGYSHSITTEEQDLVNYIISTCEDPEMAKWLQEQAHQIAFLNALRYSLRYLRSILESEDKKRRRDNGHIHIIFVAHGGVTDNFIPTSFMVPTPTIRDTILYSPWNCQVDAHVVSGIAAGSIETYHRVFMGGLPNVIPADWNRMRRSLYPLISEITVHPVRPDEDAWKAFQELFMANRLQREDRIIIPYLQEHDILAEFPFYLFVFVMSWLVMLWGKTATVHLGACLNRRFSPWPEQWGAQYAYTGDGTYMTANMNAMNIDMELHSAFKLMFG